MMKKLLMILCVALALNGCTHFIKPYRPPIQQGNIITDDMMRQLKVGMTKEQVAAILGEPVLTNTFEQDTWLYVYTFQPSKGPSKRKNVTIFFKQGRVSAWRAS